MNLFRSLLALSLALAGSASYAADPYFRFPAIRGDTVVFTAEGDLWRASVAGGKAQRLTTHPAAETQAAISPDGKLVAFSAAYEGAQEAYVMPLDGGLPKRLTFQNGGVSVLGWTPQGEVLVASEHATGPARQRVVSAVAPSSLRRRVLPLADANDAVLDDSGRMLYFTRLGLAVTNDNVKAYRGGAHAQLWRYDLQGGAEAERVFADGANHRRPMWWQGRLYFISDAGGADNLWSALPDGSDRRQLTHHQEWDVRHAALGDGRIIYQLGADLHVLDLASGRDQLFQASLVSDFDQQRTRLIRSPLEALTNIDIGNKSERLVITARGRVTIAGTGSYRRVEIAVPEGARARDAVFSHDDKWVYAIVDTSGENEIWRYPASGGGRGEQLTRDGFGNHRVSLYPSPDGKWLAHTDKHGRTWLLDLASKTNVVLDDAGKHGVQHADNVVWSPDSRHLAFVRIGSSALREQIGMVNLATRQLAFVTTDRYTARAPAFSPDGKWLYFVSARHFELGNGSPWGDRNMGPVFDRRDGVFALALQPGTRFPFKPDDELSRPDDKPAEPAVPAPEPARAAASTGAAAQQGKPDKPAMAEAKADKAAPDARAEPKKAGLPDVVYAGLAERLYEVPVQRGNYRGLALDDKRLYLLDADGTLRTVAIGRSQPPQTEVFATGVREFGMTNDHKHLFMRMMARSGPGDMLIVDAGMKAPTDLAKAKVRIEDWSVVSNPRLEWQQMFNDAWRMHRDFLYDTRMRGVDWDAVRARYAPLVERVTDRGELDDVLGMMVSEVGALHSQVRPGDVRRPPAEGVPAALGAVLTRQPDGYRVEHIYRSEPELPAERGPLAQPDVNVKEGDLIVAVNGRSLAEVRDIADLLLNQAERQVLLHVRRAGGPVRQVIVTPVTIAREAALRYADWEQSRARQVDQASHGTIGYLHLRAMGPRDIAAFARDFYANVNKDGLIIDVRRNNGGNIDSWIIEKLLRRAWSFWSSNGRPPAPNMQGTFRGHLTVLVDELTYSDGETFAAGIKALKLGTLVGKRTAGAGVWLSDGNGLVDNGMARVAEFGQFSVEDGNWLIEGVGVVPDVEVDNLPHETFAGRDRQLEVAIDLLRKKLQAQPVPPLKAAEIPVLRR